MIAPNWFPHLERQCLLTPGHRKMERRIELVWLGRCYGAQKHTRVLRYGVEGQPLSSMWRQMDGISTNCMLTVGVTRNILVAPDAVIVPGNFLPGRVSGQIYVITNGSRRISTW
jgi:hypothetical protein